MRSFPFLYINIIFIEKLLTMLSSLRLFNIGKHVAQLVQSFLKRFFFVYEVHYHRNKLGLVRNDVVETCNSLLKSFSIVLWYFCCVICLQIKSSYKISLRQKVEYKHSGRSWTYFPLCSKNLMMQRVESDLEDG